jgi:hypothetical protein
LYSASVAGRSGNRTPGAKAMSFRSMQEAAARPDDSVSPCRKNGCYGFDAEFGAQQSKRQRQNIVHIITEIVSIIMFCAFILLPTDSNEVPLQNAV